MKKVVVTVDSLSFKGKVLKKGTTLDLIDKEAEILIKAGSVEEAKAKVEPSKKVEK